MAGRNVIEADAAVQAAIDKRKDSARRAAATKRLKRQQRILDGFPTIKKQDTTSIVLPKALKDLIDAYALAMAENGHQTKTVAGYLRRFSNAVVYRELAWADRDRMLAVIPVRKRAQLVAALAEIEPLMTPELVAAE